MPSLFVTVVIVIIVLFLVIITDFLSLALVSLTRSHTQTCASTAVWTSMPFGHSLKTSSPLISQPRLAAVLDWEGARLGHPFEDLAYFCLLYHVPVLPHLRDETQGELRRVCLNTF